MRGRKCRCISRGQPAQVQTPPRSRALTALTRRILAHLERAEASEHDAHLQDDYRIAWITVLQAATGASAPHAMATYTVLGMHPDRVWVSIEARRRAMLGLDYEKIFGASSPRKPVQSVGVPIASGALEARKARAA